MTQMVAQFQMRRDQDKTKADGSNQRRMTRIAPDRRRELRKTADDDSRERGAADNTGKDSVKLRMGSRTTGTGG